MKQIGYRMPEVQALMICDLTESTGCGRSEVIRAAIQIGIKEIKMMAARDKIKAREFIAINAFNAK